MPPPLELKLNKVICPKSVATSKTSVLGGYHMYIYIYYIIFIMLHFCSVFVAAARVSLGNHSRIFYDFCAWLRGSGSGLRPVEVQNS